MGQTIAEIKDMLKDVDAEGLQAIERSLVADTRKGVKTALLQARKRVEAQQAEERRLAGMYSYQAELAEKRGAHVVVGLDEVGRGPLAGPLAIGAVVLSDDVIIPGLNDSKQLTAEARERIAQDIKEKALAWTVVYMQPEEIDAAGMTACLVTAFRRAVAQIEASGIQVDLILLDGNPLRMDKRELNVIKGDGKCASIAAASIVAKVERDALMCQLAQTYPEYGFESNKGYGSAGHMEAIKVYGLTPVHRKSFCTSMEQPTLF